MTFPWTKFYVSSLGMPVDTIAGVGLGIGAGMQFNNKKQGTTN